MCMLSYVSSIYRAKRAHMFYFNFLKLLLLICTVVLYRMYGIKRKVTKVTKISVKYTNIILYTYVFFSNIVIS